MLHPDLQDHGMFPMKSNIQENFNVPYSLHICAEHLNSISRHWYSVSGRTTSKMKSCLHEPGRPWWMRDGKQRSGSGSSGSRVNDGCRGRGVGTAVWLQSYTEIPGTSFLVRWLLSRRQWGRIKVSAWNNGSLGTEEEERRLRCAWLWVGSK